jgi:lipid A 3-O-deacylase
MHLNPAVRRKVLRRVRRMATIAVLVGSTGVAAQSLDATTSSSTFRMFTASAASGAGLGLRWGYHTDYRRATLVYETPALWSHSFNNEWGRVGLSLEFGASYWMADRGDPDSMWQLGAIPMLRWWPNETFYLEAGVGPTVMSRTRFADEELSTALQFGSRIGVGMLIADTHQLGIRYSHFSNADIKQPNPGLELVELSYTYRF